MSVAAYGERALREVSSAMLRAYLTANGWIQVADWADRAAVYSQDESGAQPRIVVPVTEAFADYPDRVLDALEFLEQVEERPAFDILNSITAVAADRFRIAAPGAADPISLHEAAHLHQEANALLNAAARATAKPRAAYGGRLSSQVSQFLEGVRPVSPLSGRFEITLHSPVPRAMGQTDILNGSHTVPFERRVSKRLSEALACLSPLIADADAAGDVAAFEGAVPQGVSANLLEAVAHLAEQGGQHGAGIGIRVQWAALRPVPDPKPLEFQFSPQATAVLDAASQHLRAKVPDLDQHLIADVVHLSSEYGESFDGQAVLMANLGGGPVALRTIFSEADKAKVIDAFKHGSFIEVDGDVVSAGRRRELRNPHNVRLLEDPVE